MTSNIVSHVLALAMVSLLLQSKRPVVTVWTPEQV
jgi:hypothetical protein